MTLQESVRIITTAINDNEKRARQIIMFLDGLRLLDDKGEGHGELSFRYADGDITYMKPSVTIKGRK